mgnify:CR=1 FL=1
MQREDARIVTGRLLKVPLWCSFACLWLVTSMLALEAFTKVVIYRIETTNALIIHGRELDTTPASSIASLAAIQVDSGLPPLPKAVADTRNNRDCSLIGKWVPPDTYSDKPQAKGAPDLEMLSHFSDLGKWERELFARLQALTVVAWSHQEDPLQAWGSSKIFAGIFKKRRVAELFARLPQDDLKLTRNLVDDVLRSGSQTVTMNDGTLLTGVLAGDRPSTVYTFTSSHEETEEAPADSIYRLDHKAYKLNLRNVSSCTGYPMNTNNRGFRGRDVSIPKPDGVFRILCIGASTTEEGPSDDRTYPAVLEKLLRYHFAQPVFEVVNCGTGGTTTEVHLSRLADYLALEPDMVILYEGVNDLRYTISAFSHIDKSPYMHVLSRSCFFQYWFNRLMFPEHDILREAIRETAIKNLRVQADVYRCHNVDVVFSTLVTPDMAHLTRDERDYFDWTTRRYWLSTHTWADDYLTLPVYSEMVGIYNRQLQSLCRERGILCVPVADCLVGGRGLFRDMVHMRNTAIELKARVFFSYLADYLPLRTETRLAEH